MFCLGMLFLRGQVYDRECSISWNAVKQNALLWMKRWVWQVDVRVGRLVVHDGALLLVKILLLRNVIYQSSFNLSVVSSIPLKQMCPMGCGSVYPYVFLGWSWQIFLVPFEFNKIILCFEDLFEYGDREVCSTEFLLVRLCD